MAPARSGPGFGVLAVALAGLLLAACADRNLVPRAGPLEPPPIPARKPSPPEGLEALAAATPAGTTIPSAYQVAAGDTVYSVAQRFGLPLRSVIDNNQLEPPFTLRPGQTLRLPSPRLHEVVAGDTVYGISRRYGVDMAALVRQNAIAEPYRITVGQRLVLPAPGGSALAQAAPVGQPSGAVPTPEQIAGLPEGRSVAPPPAAPAASEPSVAAPAPETLGDEGEAAVARPAEVAEVAPAAGAAERAPEVAAIPSPPPRAGGKFLWPLRGELLSGFGAKGGGLHNDGLNIAAPRGTEILAAENGVVAYAGNELRGFGNLLLIKHRDGWVTAYAHAERLLVRRGDKVQRGQPIALVGSSGNVSTPQLHFEIRKGTRALDPAKLLEPAVAAAG